MALNGLTGFCQAVAKTPLHHAMAGSPALFTSVETIHMATMVLLVGTITMFDLRLLRIALRSEPVSELASRLLPWAWIAFCIMAVTGTLLFTSDPAAHYCPNTPFRLKLLLIFLAGVNMSVFHLTTYRSVSKWDRAAEPPVGAKLAGLFSILLWASVVVAGRWIGFA